MTVNVLVWSADPNMTAELLLAIETSGNFSTSALDTDTMRDRDDLPDVDVAVVSLGAGAPDIVEIIQILGRGDIPIVFLGQPGFPVTIGPRCHVLPFPIDYRILARQLSEMGKADALPERDPNGGGPFPGSRHATAHKS